MWHQVIAIPYGLLSSILLYGLRALEWRRVDDGPGRDIFRFLSARDPARRGSAETRETREKRINGVGGVVGAGRGRKREQRGTKKG